MKNHPNKGRDLWKTFDNTPYELRIAKENVMFKDIFLFLDSAAYYEKMGLALPTNKNKIIDDFINEKFIKKKRFRKL